MVYVTSTDEVEIPISDEADVVLAGQQTKAVLAELAYEDSMVEELVLVVHELASNIVTHAGEGTITIDAGAAPDSGIEIEARDSGPGIADVDQALMDGYSTVGGIGGGLGTIHRLMDEVIIESTENGENGFRVVATRWDAAAREAVTKTRPHVGAVTRPKPGCEHNGDRFLIEHEPERTLVGVIDGLGHGSKAHHAATAAREYVQRHATDTLADLFDGVEEACRDTRGVVMALVRFDWADSRVAVGSVGNIAVRVCHSTYPRHVVSTRGVVGGNAPNPTLEDWKWDDTAVMVLHSDGVASNWDCGEFALCDDRSATAIAQDILQNHSKDDDATVLVARRSER